jgi:putative endonuclease
MKILEIKTENRRIGNIGEAEAKKLLKKKHYKILKTNYVATGHEIDIIAENREATVFVEVKTRKLDGGQMPEKRPASNVTPEKMRKIISCAKYYLGRAEKEKPIRFDVIEVYLSDKDKPVKIEHIESAFTQSSYK